MKLGLDEQLHRLRDDFDASFAQGNQAAAEGLRTHLTVRVGAEDVAIPIDNVRRLVREVEVVVLPGAPTHLLGVINLRGDLVSVYDMATLFGYPSQGHQTRNIVVSKGLQFEAGVAVSEIGRLVQLKEGDIGPPPATLAPHLASVVRGTAYHEGSLLLFPDWDQLFVQLDARA